MQRHREKGHILCLHIAASLLETHFVVGLPVQSVQSIMNKGSRLLVHEVLSSLLSWLGSHFDPDASPVQSSSIYLGGWFPVDSGWRGFLVRTLEASEYG